MSNPDEHPETPAPEEVPPGDQEATWLITTPPPPPPPIGAPLPAPEPTRPAGPPPRLPSASTPPVNVPAGEPPEPAPDARSGPPPSPPPSTPAGDATRPLAAENQPTAPAMPAAASPVAGEPPAAAASPVAGEPAGVGPAGGQPPGVGPTTERPAAAGPAAGEMAGVGPAAGGAATWAAPGHARPDEPVFLPPGATPAAAATGAGEGAGNAERTTSHHHPFGGGGAAARSAWREVSDISPWLLASAAILVAFIVAWFAGILLSFRHSAGLTARARILQFFAPGTLGWGLAVLVAIVLFEVGRRYAPLPRADRAETMSGARLRKKRFVELLPLGLSLAGAAVTVSTLIGVLVELTNFGNGIDAAFASLLNYLALVGVGAAETWLAFKETGKTSP